MNNTQTALTKLITLHEAKKRDRYSNVPAHAMPKSKFETETANGLTKAILTWLQLNDHYCSRIQSQGQWNQKLGIFTKSTVRRGIGDVMTIINGITVMIEIKIGKDRLSEAQIKTQEDVQKSGGLYWIVKDFDQFMDQYQQLKNTK